MNLITFRSGRYLQLFLSNQVPLFLKREKSRTLQVKYLDQVHPANKQWKKTHDSPASVEGIVLFCLGIHLQYCTLKLRGQDLQVPWPPLASPKPSQVGQVEAFRSWSHEGGSWPDTQPISPATVIPREMKLKPVREERKAEKSIGRDFEFLENKKW